MSKSAPPASPVRDLASEAGGASAVPGEPTPAASPLAAEALPLEALPEFDAMSSGEALGPVGAAELAVATALMERPAKAPRLDGKGKGKGKDQVRSRHGALFVRNVGYSDLVWTPEMQEKQESDKKKQNRLAWALYEAVEMHAGQNVTLSQLGSDFKVAELKKDPHFKNWRLLDILKAYEDVFELIPSEAAAGGMIVKLQPGAEAALPDAETRAEEVRDEMLTLPDRIDNPKNSVDKVQALRIELLHALKRRGGKCAIQELGQEPRLQEKKKLLHQAKKLVDWVKIFPNNFLLTSDGQQMVVEVISADVSDTKMIERAVGRPPEDRPSSTALSKSTRSGGSSMGTKESSSGGGRGGRDDRDRRDRDRDRRSSSSYGRSPYEAMHHSMSPYGAPPAYGYGPPPGQPPAYGAPPPSYGGYPGQPSYPPTSGYPPAQHSAPAGYSPPSSYQQPAGYSQPPSYQQPASYQQSSAYSQPPPSYSQQASYSSAPPAQSHYQQPQASYPPPSSGYGAAPPPSSGYGSAPPSSAYGSAPPPGGGSGYPPPASSGYPPPGGGYPPPGGSYPPPSNYPPPAGYPPPAY